LLSGFIYLTIKLPVQAGFEVGGFREEVMSKSLFAEKEEGVRFSFWLEGEEQAEYRLTAFQVEEALFSLTKIEVLLNLSASSLGSADRLGKHASLSIKAEGLVVPTCFSGFIAEATEFFEAGNVITRLVLLPELARLEQEPRYRVFQDLNVPDIVETILCEHGITNALWQLEGAFAPRSFCMQYGESDLAFIHRILAEEGIFYYFLHEDKGRQRPVLCNNIRLLLDCPNRGGLKHDSHGARGLYDIAGAEEVYCHSLRRSFSAAPALPGAGQDSAAAAAAPPAGLSGGAVLSGIAHLPLPLCGHKLSLQCPFDKSLNMLWYLTAVRHEGLSAEGGPLARDMSEYFAENAPGIGAAGAETTAAAGGGAFDAPGLLPRLCRVNGGPVYEDEAADYSGYGVPYNRFASNVVAMPAGARNRQAGGKSGDKKAAYACAFTALAASARYCPPAGRRPVIAGPQAAQIIAVDKKERRYKLALLINAGGRQQAENVCFWADADSSLGAAAAQAVGAEAAAAATAADNRLILEFLGGNPDKPIVLQRSKAAALPDGRPGNSEGDYAGAGAAAADAFAAAGSGRDNAAQPFIDADFDNQVKNVLADIAWNPPEAETARPPAAAAARRSDAIPLTDLRADLQNSAAPRPLWPAAASLPEEHYTAATDKTPALPVKEHQREDIGGVYELNCGEKYLCRSGSLHMNANERLVLRGPGGKIIIDGGSMTLEAPLIRLKGRLMVEESAFDRQEGVKIAIRDELPLVADCRGDSPAMGDTENSSGG